MANKRRGNRRFTMKGVRTRATLNLSTLASFDLLSGTLLSVSDNEYRLASVNATWAINGLTVTEGPILVGIAHGDYTDAEIEEAIEASASILKADKIAAEQANRLVRIVGVLGLTGNAEIGDGMVIKTKLNWAIPEGVVLKFFAYNQNASPLSTGAVVNVAGMTWIKYT